MIYILFIIVVLIYLVYKETEKNKSEADKEWDILYLVPLFIGIVMLVTILPPILENVVTPEYNMSPDETTNIVSLDTVSGLSGSFFLGSGSIENKPVYYFYEQQDDGGFRLDHIDVTDTTTLYQTNNVSPRIEKYNAKLDPLAILFFLHYDPEYKVIVPENSIVKEFNPNVH